MNCSVSGAANGGAENVGDTATATSRKRGRAAATKVPENSGEEGTAPEASKGNPRDPTVLEKNRHHFKSLFFPYLAESSSGPAAKKTRATRAGAASSVSEDDGSTNGAEVDNKDSKEVCFRAKTFEYKLMFL